MTLVLPGLCSLDGLIKKADRDAALQACLHHSPKRIYCGLLHHTREQGWNDGAASHMFKEYTACGQEIRTRVRQCRRQSS